MMRALVVVLLLLASCLPVHGQVAATAIDGAVVANNALVQALTAVQAKAKAQRKALMMQIAETATSKAQGEQQIKAVSAKYGAVFDAFKSAEGVQNALADALAVAQAALAAGDSPSLDRILSLYSQLQSAHAAVMGALAEVSP